MKKVFFGILLSLVAVFGIGFQSPSVSASDNESANNAKPIVYNPQTIEEKKLQEIDEKYKIGEELSKKDADFIKQLAKEKEEKKSDFQTMAQNTFTGQGNNPSKSVVALTLGQISDSLGYWNHQYTLSMTTKISKGKASSIQNKYSYTAYGAGYNGGIAKVYSKTESTTCKAQSCYSYFNRKYTGLVIYSVANVTGKITYSGGTFSYTVSAL